MTCAPMCLVLAALLPAPAARLPVAIPFPDCGSTVLLPVRVNGAEPRLFILDSGGNSVVVDDRLADSLRLAVTTTGAATGAGAGTVPYRRLARDSVRFEVAGVPFRSDHAIALDLSSQPAILGFAVGGVLGSDFFQSAVVEIDYDARVVRLRDPGRFVPPAGAVSVPLIFDHRLPHVDARLTVPGRPPRMRRLLVDSGSEDAVDDSVILESHGPRREVMGGVGLGRTYTVTFGRVARLELGPLALEDLPGAAPGVALLGGEVLRRFRVTFDYARERMLLVPGRHFADRAPEDRSGLALRVDGDGGRLRVEEVEPGSPAERAGIAAGDRIAALDGATARALGLRRAQAMLEAPGDTVRVRIEHGGIAREVELALRDSPPAQRPPR